jgi:hypothetical protein
VFLIHNDGRLISYVSIQKDEEMDEDIIGSMLTAILNFIHFALTQKYKGAEQITIYRFSFGRKNLIVEKSSNFFIALVLEGKEDRNLKSDVNDIIINIEDKFGHVIEDWNGELNHLKEVENIILELLPLDMLSEEERNAIRENQAKNNIYLLWAERYKAMIKNGLLPKPNIWKNFNLKL